MLSSHLNLFALHCRISSRLKSVIFFWDPKSTELKLIDDYETSYKRLSRRCIIHAFLTILIIIQGPIFFNQSSNLDDKLLYGICVVHIGIPHIHLQVCRIQGPKMCQYVNSILKFLKLHDGNRKSNYRSKLTIRDYLDLLFAYAVTPFTYASMITNLFVLHWNNPCKPSLAGHWIFLECSKQMYNTNLVTWLCQLAIRVSIFSVNLWIRMFALNVTTFVLSGFQALCVILSLRELVKLFREKCILCKMSCIRSNKLAVMYRSIQVLVVLVNEIQQWGFVGAIVLGGVLFQAFCACTVTQLPWTSENIIPLGILSVITFNSMFTIIIVVGGMGTVYVESRTALIKLKESVAGKNQIKGRYDVKWTRMFHKSCNLIKIRFGSINFVDQLTPLNCIDFANGLTVQLLLLNN